MRKVIEEDCMTPINGVVITLIEDVLRIVTGLPEGKNQKKYDRELAVQDKRNFFTYYETYEENNIGVKREIKK